MSKADKDGWIRHRGGKCPVEAGTLVDVRHRCRQVFEAEKAMIPGSAAQDWEHFGDDGDIMRYRLHKPAEQAGPVSEPVSEPVISFKDMKPGMTVRFMRFTSGSHRHWDFVVGREYQVIKCGDTARPVDDAGDVPRQNWGFEFALVSHGAEQADEPVNTAPDPILTIRDRVRELDTMRAEVEEIYQRQIGEIASEREGLVAQLASEGLALV